MKRLLSVGILGMALLASCGKDEEESQPAPAETESSATGNPLTAPVDYLGAVNKGQKSAKRIVAGLGLNQAIQAFHAQEGRYPKSLEELVTEQHISAVPPPPRGMAYQYDPATGKLQVVPQQ